MRVENGHLEVKTHGRGLLSIQAPVESFLKPLRPEQGLLTLFIQHTSASLLVQENADPAVCRDLDRFFSRLVPDGDPLFEHAAEGPDDMPAHVRAALTQSHLGVPIVDGRMALGTWQGLYVFEHRHRPHTRRIVLQYLGL